MSSRPKLSAVLNVHNEEALLRGCLEQLRFCDEILVVLDKCTDGSEAIARELADVVLTGSFDLEGQRRNYAIESASGDWLLEVDADEIVTPDLRDELLRVVADSPYDVHNVPVHNYVGGNLVLHGWGGNFAPNGKPMLFRRGVKVWKMERVHPGLEITGKPGPELVHPLIHHVDRNFSDMIRRFDSYTTKRALDLIDSDQIGQFPNMVRKIFSRFWKSYVARKGFREGGYGLVIAIFAAIYPVVSHLKAVEELERQKAGL
ncbi:glycosyltransferase [Alphaproteobacteria bacterium HT1-32]|nr:glycosyltransferase [Alphaproteobacteria bacterium HT1-32]